MATIHTPNCVELTTFKTNCIYRYSLFYLSLNLFGVFNLTHFIGDVDSQQRKAKSLLSLTADKVIFIKLLRTLYNVSIEYMLVNQPLFSVPIFES